MHTNVKETQNNAFSMKELQKLRVEISLTKSEVGKYKILISSKNQEFNDLEFKNKKNQ